MKRWWVGVSVVALLEAAGCHSKAAEPEPEIETRTGKAALETPEATERSRSESAAPVLTQVLIKSVDPETPRPILYDLLGKGLGQALVSSGAYASSAQADAERSAGLRCEVLVHMSYDVIEGQKNEAGAVFVALEAKVHFVDSTSAAEAVSNVLVERPLSRAEQNAANGILADTSDRAIREVAKILIDMEKLRRAGDAELLASLSSPELDSGLRAWSLRLAGERELSEAVEPAIAALGNREEEVVREAISALVAIGDKSAVGPLADRVDFQDYDQVRVTIEALSALGGEDARSFLDFVASGHPDLTIQAQAKEALLRDTEAAP